MTNVKLFDFLQKYLAVLIYIIASPGHTVGTYLLHRIPTGMRRQDEDAQTMTLLYRADGEWWSHHLVCTRVRAFPFHSELCICREKDERPHGEIPAPLRTHHYPHHIRRHTLSFKASDFTRELVKKGPHPLAALSQGKEASEYHRLDSQLTLGRSSLRPTVPVHGY